MAINSEFLGQLFQGLGKGLEKSYLLNLEQKAKKEQRKNQLDDQDKANRDWYIRQEYLNNKNEKKTAAADLRASDKTHTNNAINREIAQRKTAADEYKQWNDPKYREQMYNRGYAPPKDKGLEYSDREIKLWNKNYNDSVNPKGKEGKPAYDTSRDGSWKDWQRMNSYERKKYGSFEEFHNGRVEEYNQNVTIPDQESSQNQMNQSYSSDPTFLALLQQMITKPVRTASEPQVMTTGNQGIDAYNQFAAIDSSGTVPEDFQPATPYQPGDPVAQPANYPPMYSSRGTKVDPSNNNNNVIDITPLVDPDPTADQRLDLLRKWKSGQITQEELEMLKQLMAAKSAANGR